MKDHKPNRRQRRAMNRIGNKMADRIFKRNLIKKVNNEQSADNDGGTSNDGGGQAVGIDE